MYTDVVLEDILSQLPDFFWNYGQLFKSSSLFCFMVLPLYALRVRNDLTGHTCCRRKTRQSLQIVQV